MTLQEKLREWIREVDINFEEESADFIAGITQGLTDALTLLEDENVDKKI